MTPLDGIIKKTAVVDVRFFASYLLSLIEIIAFPGRIVNNFLVFLDSLYTVLYTF
jgi:hypothetical protein